MGDDEAAALRRMAGLATPMALRVAVTLGLPDRLLGDGAGAGLLAAELDVSPVALELLPGRVWGVLVDAVRVPGGCWQGGASASYRVVLG